MTVDERIRAVLVDLADGARPAPDPYGRLRSRRRRVRRRRVIGAGVGLVAVAGLVAGITLPGRGGNTPTADDGMRVFQQWAERLRETPTRGAFAEDNPGYVAEFARVVAEHQRAGAFRAKAPVSEVNVLYLDDVDGVRLAYVAFHLVTPDPTTGWENASAWFLAPSGAPPAELADPRATAGTGDGLDPFPVVTNPGNDNRLDSGISLGLAPGGCVVESAPLPAADDWKAEPTGSYVIRTRATDRAEWWRVICDGVVKQIQPAPAILPVPGLTAEQVDDALADARGDVDRKLAREAVNMETFSTHNQTTGPVRVVWGGDIAGSRPDVNGPYDGHAIVTSAPLVHGGWNVTLTVRYASPTPTGGLGTGVGGWTPDNPDDPSAVIPIRLGQSVSTLVLVPDGATTVRAVHSGTTVATASVTGHAAIVDTPDPDATKVVFEALDAAGTVLGTARVPGDPPPDAGVVSW